MATGLAGLPGVRPVRSRSTRSPPSSPLLVEPARERAHVGEAATEGRRVRDRDLRGIASCFAVRALSRMSGTGAAASDPIGTGAPTLPTVTSTGLSTPTPTSVLGFASYRTTRSPL